MHEKYSEAVQGMVIVISRPRELKACSPKLRNAAQHALSYINDQYKGDGTISNESAMVGFPHGMAATEWWCKKYVCSKDVCTISSLNSQPTLKC